MSDTVGNRPNRGYFERAIPGVTITRSKYREGQEFTYPDVDHTVHGPGLPRSGRVIVMRLVRNTSGITLLPGRSVVWEAGHLGTRVSGYSRLSNARVAGIVDEALPASGVPDGALFLIARKGPHLVRTDLAGGANNLIAAGDILHALTAASSQAVTAGRIKPQAGTWSAAETTDGTAINQIFNRIGRAMVSVTTAQTDHPLMVDLDIVL